VVIADLGSQLENADCLRTLADEFQISYLRIDHSGPWNQALAFNTALRNMPWASHIVQLDADMVLHPYLLELCAGILQARDAAGFVTSYAPLEVSWNGYDGSLRAYRDALCHSKAGIISAIGGFMVLSRPWLLKNRGYDEAYVGWGFEDGDLWIRAQQTLNTYCETSGCFVIHQAHPRQLGASKAKGNPNWEMYLCRRRGSRKDVNPLSFGEALVSRASVRHGIRQLSRQENHVRVDDPWKPHLLRHLQKGRLKPRVAPPDPEGDLLAQELELLKLSGQSIPAIHVSVLIPLFDTDTSAVRESLHSLTAQTVPPDEILLIDQGSANQNSRIYQALVRAEEKAKYIWLGGGKQAWSRAINEGLRTSSGSHALIASPGTSFHPRLLEICGSLQCNRPCFIYGHSCTIPPLARQFGFIGGVPSETWEAVAYVDENSGGSWHFTPRPWCLTAGLYDERRGTDRAGREAVSRASRNGELRVLGLPTEWSLSFQVSDAD